MIKRRQARHVKSFLETSRLKKRRRQKKIARNILFGFSIACLAFGIVSLFRAQFVQLKDVTITGNELIDSEAIRNRALEQINSEKPFFGLIQPTSSFFVKTRAIENKLKSDFLRIQSVDADISLKGHLKIAITERKAVGQWCHEETTCFDMDENGLLFDVVSSSGDVTQSVSVPASSTASSTSIASATTTAHISTAPKFAGALTEYKVGANFLNNKKITDLIGLKEFLAKHDLIVELTECGIDDMCSLHLARTRKILVDLSQDMNLLKDRLKVSLESDVLKTHEFEYIDTRFGNKIFYKLKSSAPQTASSTVTED